jgi:oligoribonuclease (3'-5' exoribonuclease)
LRQTKYEQSRENSDWGVLLTTCDEYRRRCETDRLRTVEKKVLGPQREQIVHFWNTGVVTDVERSQKERAAIREDVVMLKKFIDHRREAEREQEKLMHDYVHNKHEKKGKKSKSKKKKYQMNTKDYIGKLVKNYGKGKVQGEMVAMKRRAIALNKM